MLSSVFPGGVGQGGELPGERIFIKGKHRQNPFPLAPKSRRGEAECFFQGMHPECPPMYSICFCVFSDFSVFFLDFVFFPENLFFSRFLFFLTFSGFSILFLFFFLPNCDYIKKTLCARETFLD